MIASESEFKRVRPGLGTFVSISVEGASEAVAQTAISGAFVELERLENVFSRFRENSALSHLNLKLASLGPQTVFEILEIAEEISSDLARLCKLSFKIADASANAFDPFTDLRRREIDLTGVAKGAIVDRLTEKLASELPDCGVSVNAGGDLRYFGVARPHATLRVGPRSAPAIRELRLPQVSLAVSSPTVSENDPASNTVYPRPRRAGISADHTVAVSAPLCAVADALTKVALFGEPAVIEEVASAFEAQIFVFDQHGELAEHFGAL